MSKKLLLADDSITIQKVIQITFAHEDYDLTITDNGTGQRDKESTGFGLLGLRERVTLLGGSLEVGNDPEGGFRLYIAVPLQAEGQRDG